MQAALVDFGLVLEANPANVDGWLGRAIIYNNREDRKVGRRLLLPTQCRFAEGTCVRPSVDRTHERHAA